MSVRNDIIGFMSKDFSHASQRSHTHSLPNQRSRYRVISPPVAYCSSFSPKALFLFIPFLRPAVPGAARHTKSVFLQWPQTFPRVISQSVQTTLSQPRQDTALPHVSLLFASPSSSLSKRQPLPNSFRCCLVCKVISSN